MNYKRITLEEVAARVVENKEKGRSRLRMAALAGIVGGTKVVSFNPERPWALEVRHAHPDPGKEGAWSLHPWRFPTIISATRAASDLRKTDPRIECRVTNTDPELARSV